MLLNSRLESNEEERRGGRQQRDFEPDAHTRQLELVRKEVASGVAADRIVVAGFSHGAAIALEAALRSEQVRGMSKVDGFVPGTRRDNF